MLSILTPAFNESANLERLHARLADSLGAIGLDWEWVIVDDHSRDDTFAVIDRLARADRRVRGVRLSRNSGSHVAITCGLHRVRGDAAVMATWDPELRDRRSSRGRRRTPASRRSTTGSCGAPSACARCPSAAPTSS